MNVRNVLTIVYFVLMMDSFTRGLVHGVANYSSWKLIRCGGFSSRSSVRQPADPAVYVPFF